MEKETATELCSVNTPGTSGGQARYGGQAAGRELYHVERPQEIARSLSASDSEEGQATD